MIGDVLAAYPELSRAAMGVVSAELIIIGVSIAWMVGLGWLIMRKLDQQDEIERWFAEQEDE